MALLRFVSNLRKGESVALTHNPITFGRQLSCDCVLSHPTVSREHFFIEYNGGKYFVVDKGSGNGTFVNGERISWVELKDGDVIRAGPFLLRAELSERGASASAPQTERQHAGAFDEEIERAYPGEYLDGVRLFNEGKYFEAHEAWEEIWQHSAGETKFYYQMLIQAAVSLYHFENGNPRGARGMYERVIDKLAHLPKEFMSLDLVEFARQYKNYLAGLGDEQNETLIGDRPRPRINLRMTGSDTVVLSLSDEDLPE